MKQSLPELPDSVSFASSAIVLTEGEFTLCFSDGIQDTDMTLVLDVYDLDNPVHPQGHLGWWQFSLKKLQSHTCGRIKAKKNTIEVSLEGIAPIHFWVNEANVAYDRLIINAVLRENTTNKIIYISKIPAFKNDKDLATFRADFQRDVDPASFAYAASVMPQETTVRIVCHNIFTHDAVGNLCLELFQMLRQNRINVELYAEVFDLTLNDIVRRMDRLQEDVAPQDRLLYFFSSYDPFLERILTYKVAQKIAYFHGVTQPALLQAFYPELSIVCGKAIDQIKMLALFDTLAANSHTSAKVLLKAFEQPFSWKESDIVVIPPRLFSRQIMEAHLSHKKNLSKETRFLYVGRTISHKKIEDILEFFSAYLALDKHAECWIVGGNANKAYQDYLHWVETELLHLPKGKVKWLSSLDNAQLLSAYTTATVYISMSEDEGFCLPVLEAMLTGLPVFAYGLPVIRELMNDTGLTFQEKNFPQLASALQAMLKNPHYMEAIITRQREHAIAIAKEMDGRKFLRLLGL